MRISYWSSDVCSSDLHFRKLRNLLLDTRLHRLTLIDRCPWNAQHLCGQIALVELRKKLLPKKRERQDRGQKGPDANPHSEGGSLHRLVKPRLISALEPRHNPAFLQTGRTSCRERVCQYV